MKRKIQKMMCALVAAAGVCLPAAARESDSASVTTLALQMMAEHPKVCLGIETVPDLKAHIRGGDSIAEAKRNWESLRKVAGEQTDYVVDVNGNDVLIRPKSAPKIHDGPVVERTVSLSSASRNWHSIAEALGGMSFDDKSKKFGPGITETSMTYSADHPLQMNPNLASSSEALLQKIASTKTIKLSDMLFLIARMANANVWSYEASESIVINGKKKVPRELTEGNISFSGPSR